MYLQALAVFVGGGLGSLLRWSIALSTKHYMGAFPMHTLIANFLASLILGLSIAYFAGFIEKPPFWYPFLAVGFCGGFSTFSTFSSETFQLLNSGELMYALLNIFISVATCLIAIALGFWLYQSGS